MDKIKEAINSLSCSFWVLNLCDNINEKIYKEMVGRLNSIITELERFRVEPANEGITFSQMEKFVNSHINFADSDVLLRELQRRGIKKEDLDEISSIINENL